MGPQTLRVGGDAREERLISILQRRVPGECRGLLPK